MRQPNEVQNEPGKESVTVLVELIVPSGHEAKVILQMVETSLAGFKFRLDPEFTPVPMTPLEEHRRLLLGGLNELLLVRGTLPKSEISDLEELELVVKVSRETYVEPFSPL